MIIVMKTHAESKNVEAVVQRVEELGYKVHLSRGEARTIIGVIGADEHLIQNSTFEVMDGVERTMRVMQPYKLASRDFSATNTVIEVNGVQIGGKDRGDGRAVQRREPRYDPGDGACGQGGGRDGVARRRVQAALQPLQLPGLGEEGLKYLAEAREATGLPVITEVMSPEDVALVGDYTDIFQIGARNTQNYSLLKALGKQQEAGLSQARHQRHDPGIADERRVHPCWRQHAGDALRARHPHLRDRHAQHLRHQRDSRAQGFLPPARHRRSGARHRHVAVCGAVAKAAVAAGADGLMLEVHPDPARAWSDGAQSLTFERFRQADGGIAAGGAGGRKRDLER
jgi:3-deoxy-7-phosphoheptulonate synthase